MSGIAPLVILRRCESELCANFAYLCVSDRQSEPAVRSKSREVEKSWETRPCCWRACELID